MILRSESLKQRFYNISSAKYAKVDYDNNELNGQKKLLVGKTPYCVQANNKPPISVLVP